MRSGPSSCDVWCAREDLNLHLRKETRPSTVRVCQFRHSRVTRGLPADA